MPPTVEIVNHKNNVFRFNILDINISLANALRRTILSDILTVIFRTFPYDKNEATIHENTTRFNNEFLKQRLGCIPVHITDDKIDLDNYIVEIKKQNDTDTIQFVTTEDFKIKDVKTGKYVTEKENQKIFPPNSISKDYILFARLRPFISKDLPGEKLHITAKLSRGTAKEDGMYNVVSTCSYRMSPDEEKQDKEWAKIEKNKTDEDRTNWYNHDAKRYYKADCFDFIVESVGVFKNNVIVKKALDVLVGKFQFVIDNPIKMTKSLTTIPNSFDIKLENEDYTIGKCIEYQLNADHYSDNKILNYVGFKKFHPHDSHSIIRVGFLEPTEKDAVVKMCKEACTKLIATFNELKKQF